MAPHDSSAPGLRVAVPTLEPDPDFLAELSQVAAGSGAAGPPAGTMGLGWRTGLAAAGVATVVASSAWMAAAMIGDSDGAPDQPAPPVTQPAEPRSGDGGPEAPANDDADTSGSADRGQQDRGTAHRGSGDTSGTGASQLPPSASHGDESQGQHDEVQQEQAHDDGPAEPEGNATPEKQEDANDQGAEGGQQGDDADQDQQGYDDPGNDNGSDGLVNGDQGDDPPANEAGPDAPGDNTDQNLADLDGSND